MQYKNLKVCLWTITLFLVSIPTSWAAPLFDRSDCEALGAVWMNGVPGSGRFGSCTVASQLTVPRGDVLEVGPSVDLAVPGGTRLINHGGLELRGTSKLIINGGTVENLTQLNINNNAELIVDQGWLNNTGRIEVDGKLTNEPSSGTVFTWGIFNSGNIHIIRGGELWNHGEIIEFPSVRADQRTLIVDLDGALLNEPGGRWHPNDAHVFGLVRNAKGAEILLRHRLQLHSNGSITNAGYFAVWSEASAFVIDEQATLSSTSGSQLKIDGGTVRVNGNIDLAGATLENRFNRYWPNGRLWVMPGGLVTVQLGGHLINRKDADFHNDGTIILKCIAFFTEEQPITGNGPWSGLCKDFQPKVPAFPPLGWN